MDGTGISGGFKRRRRGHLWCPKVTDPFRIVTERVPKFGAGGLGVHQGVVEYDSFHQSCVEAFHFRAGGFFQQLGCMFD